MRATPILLLAVMLLPTGVACSLAGPAPGPGAFTLWPHAGGDPIVVEVHGRSLGGTCDLSNDHALVEGVFTWIEQPEMRPGPASLHRRDLATGEERVVDLGLSGVQDFGLWKDGIVTYSVEYTAQAPDGQTRFLLHDGTGDAETLPFPDGRWTGAAIGGRHVAASLRTNGFEGPDLLYLYDLAERRFVFEAKPARDIVGDDILWPRAVDDRWLVAGGRLGKTIIYEIATGRVLDGPLSDGPGGVTLANGTLYSWGYVASGERIQRRLLPDGPAETIPLPKGDLVGVVEGYTITGSYFGQRATEPGAAPNGGSWIAGLLQLLLWVLSRLFAW